MVNPGIIVLWFGSIGNIPAGWLICDGTNGTPNLKNKFIVGAGDSYAVDDVGGAAAHDHTFTTNGHFHSIPAGTALGSGTQADATTDPAQDTGTTENGSNLPPFHALAYIMKS